MCTESLLLWQIQGDIILGEVSGAVLFLRHISLYWIDNWWDLSVRQCLMGGKQVPSLVSWVRFLYNKGVTPIGTVSRAATAVKFLIVREWPSGLTVWPWPVFCPWPVDRRLTAHAQILDHASWLPAVLDIGPRTPLDRWPTLRKCLDSLTASWPRRSSGQGSGDEASWPLIKLTFSGDDLYR